MIIICIRGIDEVSMEARKIRHESNRIGLTLGVVAVCRENELSTQPDQSSAMIAIELQLNLLELVVFLGRYP
jgi:hypothetical protein